MIKQNKNRGAGLVTVVTVLAVCSILLAGVVAISFNHYKNAIRQTQSREELAEIELFAELVGELNIDSFDAIASIDEEAQEATLLAAFYSFTESVDPNSGNAIWRFESVPSGEKSRSSTIYVTAIGEKKYEVKCNIADGDFVAKTFQFDGTSFLEVSP